MEDNIIIGQIALYKMSIQLPTENLTKLVISPLSAHPMYFRRDITTALINAGLTQAQKTGYKAAFWCEGPNFYRKLGFSATYHYDIYHVKDNLAKWYMVKELVRVFLNTVSGIIDIE